MKSALTGGMRVNLLPAIEVERRQQRTLLHRWIVGVIGHRAVVTVALLGVSALRLAADQRLTAEQQRTMDLTVQLAGYSEVSRTMAAQGTLENYRASALGNDLAWGELLADIAGALPSGVSVTAFQLTPGADPAEGVDPSTAIGLSGTITCTSNDASDQQRTVRRLREVPGAMAMDAGSLSTLDSGGYEFTVTIVFDQSRYSGRFTEEVAAR